MTTEQGWSDYLRSNAAHAAEQADIQDGIARHVRAMPPLSEPIERDGETIDVNEFADSCEALAYRLRTFQRISGEVGRAYDEMIARGGPDNSTAYASYRAATERASALLSIPGPVNAPDLGT